MAETAVSIESARGDILLVIDENGLSASLHFTPSGNGRTWSEETVSSYLREQRIEKPDPELIADAVRRFREAETPITAIVANGIPPVPPAGPTPGWEPRPIPPEYEELCTEVLGRARPPEIVVQREEKIKRIKIVQKKGQLPFQKPREERQVVYEKVKKDVRIEVDPRVVDTGFVRTGDLVCVLEPPKPGSPGRTVQGAPIHPGPVTDSGVYRGAGLELRKNSLIATATGFLRKGTNWVDVVPFSSHEWNVSFSRDFATCLLSFRPGPIEKGLPVAEEIVEVAVEQGFPRSGLIATEEIELLLRRSFERQEPLEKAPISPDRDAEIRVEAAKDKLEAHLFLRKGQGTGAPLDLKAVGAEIRKAGFKGLDLDTIRSDILSFYRGPSLELSGYTVAKGVPPERGADREVTFLVSFLSDEESAVIRERLSSPDRVKETEGETIEVNEITALARVAKDQKIAIVSPPSKGQSGRDIFGAEIPGIPGNDPDIRPLHGVRVQKEGFFSESDGVLEIGKRNGTTLLRVRPYRDAAIDVRLSPDRMKAYLSITDAVGSGKPVSLEDVNRGIEEKGIVKGIDGALVSDAVRRATRGEIVSELEFAEGLPPQDGSDNRIKFHIAPHTPKNVTIRADGTADYRNQDRIVPVKEGDVVAEILPPKLLPRDGWDVTGRTIPAKQPAAPKITIGKNVLEETDEEGAVKLIAETNGELLFQKGVLEIRDTHVIKGDLDFSQGNVKFPGRVYVQGSVLPGFHILAGGDVLVEQVVQEALVSSDGNLTVRLGVKGNGKAVLRTKQTIEVGFAEQTVLLAVGDIRVEKACMHSKIKCNGRVVLGADKSVLLGGSIKARKGIETVNLGSEKGIRTEISFGQDYLIQDQIDQEEKAIEQLKKQIAQLDFAMKRNEATADRNALEAARKEKLRLLKILEKRSFRVFSLRERFEEHYPSDIVVRGTLHAGVVFESHGRFLEVNAEKKHVRIFFDAETGRIKEEPFNER